MERRRGRFSGSRRQKFRVVVRVRKPDDDRVTLSTQWQAAVRDAENALSARRVDDAVSAAHRALGLAESAAQQVTAQYLLGHALIVAGKPEAARVALRGALTFAVDLPVGHPAVAMVLGLLRSPDLECGPINTPTT